MLKEVIAHTLEEEVLSSEGDLASWPGWRFCDARRAGTKKNNWPSWYSSVPQLLQLHALLAHVVLTELPFKLTFLPGPFTRCIFFAHAT
jgi:hypothetical protein